MSVTKTGLAFFFVIQLSLIISMLVPRYQIDDKILLLHIVTLVHAFASNNNASRNLKKKINWTNQFTKPSQFPSRMIYVPACMRQLHSKQDIFQYTSY